MKKNAFTASATVLLIVILSSSVATFTLWPRQQTKIYADFVPINRTRGLPNITIRPNTLRIPRLKITLHISQGAYDATTETWGLNDHDAFINADQPVASTVSNSPLVFLYGHNTDKVLGKTIHLKPGDELILNANHHALVYRFTQTLLVSPTETEVISDTSRGNLALLSCSGLLSEQRRIMYFTLERAE